MRTQTSRKAAKACIKCALICAALWIASCGIPPVDTQFISETPADPQSYVIAERAVRACTGLPDRDTVLRSFETAGFGVAVEQVAAQSGRTVPRVIVSPPDEAVVVLYLGNSCYVGLEGMTPSQSAQLAQIWVEAHRAEPNSAFGDGLSDHVAGAWRRFFTEPHRIPDKAAYTHRIFIAAYKTWPHGPYDPQRQVGYSIPAFPEKPGAAISLSHVIQCRPQVSTGPGRGVFLPCSGPEYTAE
ncbi:MAG: hypothetical protein AAGD43_01600 [Pseudomonadota bacterium]